MYSDKAYDIAENCRFCWMCRHVCPIGLITGKEINTPRARGLLVAMEKRGFAMEESFAQAVYDCMLCESCSNDCATGYEPTVFIREARTQAAASGLLPTGVEEVLNRILEKGHMLETHEENAELREWLKSHEKSEEVLLFLGETALYRVPRMALAVMKLLERAGISFLVMKEEPATGSELFDLIGSVEETRQQALRCSRKINETAAKTLVVLDSCHAETIKHQYPGWGCDLSCQVVTATAYLEKLVGEGRLQPAAMVRTVTVHDASRLARGLGETESVRNLLKAAGCEISEMFLNRKLSKCCGSGLFAAYAPALAIQTAEGRMEDARRTGAEYLIAECPQSLDILGMADSGDMIVTDIFSLLAESCGKEGE